MNDDLDWAEALAGRARPGADPATLQEAALLRDAARRWPAALPADLQLNASDASALLQRARAEGLLQARPGWCPGCAARWRALRARPFWLGLGGGGLVLASVLVALMVMPMRSLGPADEAPVLRAPADGVWLLRAADPQARRDGLADALAAQGVVARRYERLGRFGLDADLPLPVPAPLRAQLRRDGVAPAADGSLRVEVERSTP